MPVRYRAGLVLTLALFLLMGARAGAAKLPAHRNTRVEDIYSSRALRRARIILQLKLLELRGERLEYIRKVIERNIRGFNRPPPKPS